MGLSQKSLARIKKFFLFSVPMNPQKDWKAKLERAHFFKVRSDRITVCPLKQNKMCYLMQILMSRTGYTYPFFIYLTQIKKDPSYTFHFTSTIRNSRVLILFSMKIIMERFHGKYKIVHGLCFICLQDGIVLHWNYCSVSFKVHDSWIRVTMKIGS